MTATEREAWLAERRKGIGSSDAASACGLEDAYGTPHSVAMDKIYGITQAENEQMHWGNLLEQIVADHYARVYETPLAKPAKADQHPVLDWMLANIDREDAAGNVVEIKTSATSRGWGPMGSDDVPAKHYLQAQHQIKVRELDGIKIAALIGGSDFRVYTIARNDDIIGRMVKAEGDLWQMILRKEVPAPDFRHPLTAEIVARTYSPAAHRHVEITDPAEAMPLLDAIDRLRYARAKAREHEKAKAAAKVEIEFAMKDACVLRLPGGVEVVRKQINRAGFTVKPSSFFRMDFKGVDDGDE